MRNGSKKNIYLDLWSISLVSRIKAHMLHTQIKQRTGVVMKHFDGRDCFMGKRDAGHQNDRIKSIVMLYTFLGSLENKLGGKQKLSECNGRMDWPSHGVYFFFEEGEIRQESGDGQRVVRVGTHALNESSKNTLWKRLGSHRGNADGQSGNQRGSIFRRLVGEALINQARPDVYPKEATVSWGKGNSAPVGIRRNEIPVEKNVSEVIGNMPFLWLAVSDRQQRGIIEEYCVSLLSNFDVEAPIDRPSDTWLGRHLNPKRARHIQSGLWQTEHVDSVLFRQRTDFVAEVMRPLLKG